MFAIYLTPQQSVWCLGASSGHVDCLLPLLTDRPSESVRTSQFGQVAIYDNCVDPPCSAAVTVDLRDLYSLASPEQYAVAARAVPLAEWRRSARFCGCCSTALQRDDNPDEPAMVCPSCAHRVYPRINPVAIVRVTRGSELLLARRAGGPAGRFFSVVAGFVEAGETLEDAARREVLEETGLKIKNLRYFESQPWSFPNNLMIGFTAEYESGIPRPDGVEIAETGWYHRNNLPALPGSISIARRMIDAWLNEHRPRPRE